MSPVPDGARASGVSAAPRDGSLNGHAASLESEAQAPSRARGWDAPARPPVLTANLIGLSLLLIVIGAVAGYLISGTVAKTYAARFQVTVPTTATDDAL